MMMTTTTTTTTMTMMTQVSVLPFQGLFLLNRSLLNFFQHFKRVFMYLFSEYFEKAKYKHENKQMKTRTIH
jgi:hypothetical protein